MKRNIFKELQNWKQKKSRKPLVLKGARQVGKTFILQEFGKHSFTNFHYIDFRKQTNLYAIFKETTDPKKILQLLQFELKIKIDIQKDLVIFDEIQECSGAITSFKYFEQDLKELAIIGAGSHLGMIRNEESFPVGKVNFLHMFPMTFDEFLNAFDVELFKEYEKFDLDNPTTVYTVVHNRMLEALKYYFLTGGLPEVILTFLESFNTNISEALHNARNVQKELVEGYKADFSKYSGTVNANHIHNVFESIPMQLSKAQEEVKKFIFKDIIHNQKGFSRIRNPLGWLINSKLCIKNLIAKKTEHPLKGYCDENRFKMFLFDVGILNCMLNTTPESIVLNQLGSYKGFIAENFVAQEFYSVMDDDLISLQEGRSEIEFIIARGNEIIPVEVKSSNRSRRSKSLDAFIKKYNPVNAYKISGQNFGYNNKSGFTTLPIYFCSKIIR